MSELANTLAHQNSKAGSSVRSQIAVIAPVVGVAANTWVFTLDAEAMHLHLKQVDADGVTVAAAGEVDINLETLTGLGLGNVKAEFRELHWKDATSCVEYKAAFLMTLPEVA